MKTKKLNERINSVLQFSGLKKYQFAEKIGVSKAFMSDVTLLKQSPSSLFLVGISEHFPQIDMHWLLSGRGEMLLPKEKVQNLPIITSEELAAVIRTVELALAKVNINPPPEKRARLVVAAYDLYIHSNKPKDTQPIVSLIASAAS